MRVPASGQIRRQTLGVEDRKAPFGEITQETRSRSRSSGELPSVLPQIRQTREEDERSRHGGTVLSHYRNESLHHINRSANASTEESEEGLEIGGQSGQNLNTPPRAHSAAAEAPNSTGGPDTSRKVDCMRFALVFQTQILPWIRSATVRHANGLSAAAQQQIGNWVSQSPVVRNSVYLRLISILETQTDNESDRQQLPTGDIQKA